MAARRGIQRMARLGFGAIEPQAGMAAIGAILAGSGLLAPPQLLGSVFHWDRCSCMQPHLVSGDYRLASADSVQLD